MSLKNPVVAVIGATGVVGGEMINILMERKFPYSEIKAFASKDSAGEIYKQGDEELVINELAKDSFEGVDIALFAAGAKISEEFAPIAVEAGAFAIDNSSHFRMQKEIPLLVPEVNPDSLSLSQKLIANPNCSTIQLVPVLKLIQDKVGIKRVVISTYQAVSGAGRDAMDELFEQTKALFNQQEMQQEAFQHQIAFNCIPQIDVFMDDAYTKEEYKLINESKKILGLPNLAITATAVRVPVFNAHAESVNVETEKAFSPEELTSQLQEAKGVQVFKNTAEYPMQIDIAGEDDIFVGRIRKDFSVEHGLNFWVVADNLRKGAALNAVQIAEHLLKLDA